MPRDPLIPWIVSAFGGRARLYASLRFLLIRPPLLGAVERHLPSSGAVLDAGCGFGLFTLWMAARKPGAEFVGLDTDAVRIAAARRAAKDLDIRNARFECTDVRSWMPTAPLAAVFAIDLLHHLSPDAARELPGVVRSMLQPGGVFVAKDVDDRPLAGRMMCRLTDAFGSPGRPVRYLGAEAWACRMKEAGFARVEIERLRPILPYPHIVLVSSAPG